MITLRPRSILVLLAGAFACAGAHADDNRVQFVFDASAGLEYDNNVALQDLDSSTGEADTATVLEAGLQMIVALGESSRFRIGYDVSATAYEEFSAYDLTLHHLAAELSRRGPVDLAVAVDHFDGVLDGEDYVTFTQVSPNVSRLFGERLFLRGAYVAADKEYASLASRNADSDALRVDSYWLLDGMQRYWSVGLQKSSDDATDPELDFEAAQIGITYAHSFGSPSVTLQVKTRLRYEEREYQNVTQSIGAKRRDRRWRGGISARIPFNEHVLLEADVEATDNTSNLDSAVLEKLTFGLGLAVSF